ncbi:MAG: hypothetical protein AABZ55_02305 [Bdellovibrionota bacterium]
MQGKSRPEIYQNFVEVVIKDLQQERSTVNRRMFEIFKWCFLAPAAFAMLLLLLVRLRILPISIRAYTDWVLLGFPVLYASYVLFADVISNLPALYRKGGVANNLGFTVQETAWRDRVCRTMGKSIESHNSDWEWIIPWFQMDLDNLKNRYRYLTVLSGVVLFMIVQGMDFLGPPLEKATWVKIPIFGWLEASGGDFSEYIGLALFLMVFYWAGMQKVQTLTRYLNCAKLVKNGYS